MGTLRQTVMARHGAAAWELLTADDTADAVRRAIGTDVSCGDEIIVDMPFEQLKLSMATARFADSCDECVAVARMVHWLVRRPDVFPMVSCHRGFDLASRCLVCLALFRRAMEARRNRGYPSPSFYRTVGIKVSENEGLDGVARHFDSWLGFVGEHLGS